MTRAPVDATHHQQPPRAPRHGFKRDPESLGRDLDDRGPGHLSQPRRQAFGFTQLARVRESEGVAERNIGHVGQGRPRGRPGLGALPAFLLRHHSRPSRWADARIGSKFDEFRWLGPPPRGMARTRYAHVACGLYTLQARPIDRCSDYQVIALPT